MKHVLLLMIVVLAVGALAPTAHAAMKLSLNDAATPGIEVELTDNGPGDNDTRDGIIVYMGVIGNWTLNVTTGTSKPFIGGVIDPEMDLNSVNAASSAGGTMRIMLTDTDFYAAPGWTSTSLISGIGGTTVGTVWLDQVLDAGNAEFATSGALSVSLGPLTGDPSKGNAFSAGGTDSGPLVTGPFSLTEIAVITHSGAALTSFDAKSKVVPAPGAVLLGMLGLCVAGIKLRKFA